jgi:Fe-S-cluster-containing hydrogenase component 2
MSHRLAAAVAVVDHQLCDECGLCMPLCPPMAIEMRREGLLVDALTCTGCRKCIAPCPVGALRMIDNPALGGAAGRTTAGLATDGADRPAAGGLPRA